jgi:hypothetical protein
MMLNEFSPNFINSLAGATQATLVTITGYPFDLVKTRLQANRYPNTFECIKKTYMRGGITSFYRGSAMPWLSHMIKRPIQHPLSEYMKNYAENNHATFFSNYFIGASTAVLGSFTGTPLQVIKVNMQSTLKDGAKYQNSWQFIKYHYKQRGIVGFYRGFVSTLMKDGVFGMSFVGNYYTFRDIIGSDRWWKNFISSATAHCITWCLFIPIDYVKTTIQRNTNKKLTIPNVVRKTIKTDGLRVFWRGVIPACLRTIPVSGFSMIGYEFVRQKYK